MVVQVDEAGGHLLVSPAQAGADCRAGTGALVDHLAGTLTARDVDALRDRARSGA
ncbi:hypothetical protein AB0H12_30575 [Actinosynnema sp. NPDC023794]